MLSTDILTEKFFKLDAHMKAQAVPACNASAAGL